MLTIDSGGELLTSLKHIDLFTNFLFVVVSEFRDRRAIEKYQISATLRRNLISIVLVMSFLLRGYQRGVSKYPYLAQGLQSSILMATGDAIAQIGVEKKKQFDYKRWECLFCVINKRWVNRECLCVLGRQTFCSSAFAVDSDWGNGMEYCKIDFPLQTKQSTRWKKLQVC